MMLLDSNAVVLLLNELEDLGYSVRRRDPEDQRRHIVELTQAGQQALDGPARVPADSVKS